MREIDKTSAASAGVTMPVALRRMADSWARDDLPRPDKVDSVYLERFYSI